jgi:hypothetical protein
VTATVQDPAALRWRDGLVPVLVGWVWARCCIAAGWVLSDRLGDVLDNPRQVLGAHSGLLTWDGLFYRDLAVGWYDAVPEAGARFFPLYPALARLLSPLVGVREDWALVIIANVAAFGGAWVLWRLVREVVDAAGPVAVAPGGGSTLLGRLTGSVADRAAWMVAIAPAAFVLAWAYTEGLALLLVAATLLALHRRAFVWAGVFALLSAALRPVGGLLLVPIAIELWRARPRPSWPVVAAAVVAPVVGLLLALGTIAATTGDVWIPLEAQRELRGGMQDPITRILEPIGELVKGNFRDTYNLAHMWVLLALYVVAWRRRQPMSWLAYAGLTLLLTLSSQQTDSLGRYALVVVPFVVALAQWADRRWRQVSVAVISSLGLVWLTSEALMFRLVP